MGKVEVIEKVRKYTEMIIPELNPSMVVLFGSYAKGTEIRGIWVRVSNLFLRGGLVYEKENS